MHCDEPVDGLPRGNENAVDWVGNYCLAITTHNKVLLIRAAASYLLHASACGNITFEEDTGDELFI